MSVRGRIEEIVSNQTEEVECPVCHGDGKVGLLFKRRCQECNGLGNIVQYKAKFALAAALARLIVIAILIIVFVSVFGNLVSH